MKPLALDLFCGAGGASAGLAQAGFDVLGLDIASQPNYPFRFAQIDVFKINPSALRAFDFVWASPPCQGRTAYKRRPGHVRDVDTDGAIELTRKLLILSGVPYVIENVPGAPLWQPIMLCGSMFGLDVRRHRIFEGICGRDNERWLTEQLPCKHELQRGSFPQATNRANRRRTAEIGVWRIPLETQQKAMGGLHWMTREELSEAIPSAYSEWIARRWLDLAGLAQSRLSTTTRR